MSICAKLIDTYNSKLMSDQTVRDLMRNVAQDPQNETVNHAQTFIDLRKFVDQTDKAVINVARRNIIGWLNHVYFAALQSPFPREWWYEMGTRLTKILSVSMFLEGRNLWSFGVEKVEFSDIPQCLIWIKIKVLEERKKNHAELNERHISFCNDLNADDKEGCWYLNLYMSK